MDDFNREGLAIISSKIDHQPTSQNRARKPKIVERYHKKSGWIMDLHLLLRGSLIGANTKMWNSLLFNQGSLLKTAILNVLIEAFERKCSV
jgi:hypothetical protein